MPGTELRIVLVGWGAIGPRVAELLEKGPGKVRIVAVGVSDARRPRGGLPHGAFLIADPAELAGIDADLLVEVAGRAAVAPWADGALALGWDVAISSTSALTDADVMERLTRRARAHSAQILLPSGAIGGIDALSAASRMALTEVRHEIVKPVIAWSGSRAEGMCDLAALTAAHTFFEGTAREAADAFPRNANVAVITALAGLGLDRTTVALTADPAAARIIHRITARGDFGCLSVSFENRPFATNPQSSELSALSIVRLIENRVATLVL